MEKVIDHSVKATVRRMLIQYPSLFVDKSDCYNFLFFVIGNGYEWEGGALVRIAPARDEVGDEPRWVDETGARPEDEEFSSIPELEEFLRAGRAYDARKRNHAVRFVLENFEDMWRFESIERFTNPYPACSYSRIYGMPADVKPDWRDACDLASTRMIFTLSKKPRPYLRVTPESDKIISDLLKFRDKHFSEENKATKAVHERIRNAIEAAKHR